MLISWQMFVPPIIGLADQGDFVRILGPLGYAPKPKGPDHKYFYLTRKFVWDPGYREPRWEQITSEFIPASVAIGLNRTVSSQWSIDLTSFGIVHAVLFVTGVYRLLRVLRHFGSHRIAWAGLLLVVTDVGYVEYWNSLYTEPASFIWLIFLAAESVDLCLNEQPTAWQTSRWSILAILLVTAKTQNAALSLPLAAYAALLAWRAEGTRNKIIKIISAASIVTSGLVMYGYLLPAPRLVGVYNMIFMAILPESRDPASDLESFGLSPRYARYSGTVAWSPGTGIADAELVNSVQARVNTFSIIKFYLVRPGRMWTHIHLVLTSALSLRPECCGNFEVGSGKSPGAKSYGVALWSYFHQEVLSRVAVFLLCTVGCFPLIGLMFLFTLRDHCQQFHRAIEMAI